MAEVKNWIFGGSVDLQGQFAQETDRTQHPDWVLAIALVGVANNPQAFVLSVGPGATVIIDATIFVVVIQRVQGEVPALGIVLDAAAVDIVTSQHADGILAGLLRRGIRIVGRTEGRDFKDFGSHPDVHNLKAPADDSGTPKQF